MYPVNPYYKSIYRRYLPTYLPTTYSIIINRISTLDLIKRLHPPSLIIAGFDKDIIISISVLDLTFDLNRFNNRSVCRYGNNQKSLTKKKEQQQRLANLFQQTNDFFQWSFGTAPGGAPRDITVRALKARELHITWQVCIKNYTYFFKFKVDKYLPTF